MRQLIYEKFRSQIAFESGLHFAQLHRREGQTSIALLEAKCSTLMKDLTDAKRDNVSELESLQAQVRSKDRECIDLKASSEIVQQKYAALEAQQAEDQNDLKSELGAEKTKLQEALNEAKQSKEAAEADLQRVQR